MAMAVRGEESSRGGGLAQTHPPRVVCCVRVTGSSASANMAAAISRAGRNRAISPIGAAAESPSGGIFEPDRVHKDVTKKFDL